MSGLPAVKAPHHLQVDVLDKVGEFLCVDNRKILFLEVFLQDELIVFVVPE